MHVRRRQFTEAPIDAKFWGKSLYFVISEMRLQTAYPSRLITALIILLNLGFYDPQILFYCYWVLITYYVDFEEKFTEVVTRSDEKNLPIFRSSTLQDLC